MIEEHLDEKELAKQTERNNEYRIPTRFNFLRRHFGIRPGNLSGLMGTMGCGKSTLIKTIIADAAAKIKTLVWLSEESPAEYQILLNKIVADKSFMDNVKFLQEKGLEEMFFKNIKTFLSVVEYYVKQSRCKFLVIDNVTTSYMYSEEVGFVGQRLTSSFLSDMAKRLDLAILYVAHTKSTVYDNQKMLITPEDIRGLKQLPMQSEYFYTFQKMTTDGVQSSFIRVCKYRHHTNASGFYKLVFDNEKKFYDLDTPSSFGCFKDINKGADRI